MQAGQLSRLLTIAAFLLRVFAKAPNNGNIIFGLKWKSQDLASWQAVKPASWSAVRLSYCLSFLHSL
jgi:hypothetical protein